MMVGWFVDFNARGEQSHPGLPWGMGYIGACEG